MGGTRTAGQGAAGDPFGEEPPSGGTLTDQVLTGAADASVDAAAVADARNSVAVSAPPRGPADPVKLLIHRHRRLCERAVDPLEIAAGLEAHGITDRTAARFLHRDVFSLAEELYARVPRPADAAPALRDSPRPPESPGAPAGGLGRAGWTALSLLPGVICVLAFAGLRRTSGQSELAIALAGAFALSGALSSCLRRGPLRAGGRTVPAVGLWVYWLLAYLLCGDGLLAGLVGGGPDGPWAATLTPLAALAFAVVPAAWCAHLFSVHARRRLTGSRGLADFAAGARPVLLTTVALYACALSGLALLANGVYGDPGPPAPTVVLGILLFLARLLTVHGFPDPAATGLAAACAVEALASASVLAGRLPGCEALAAPVRDAVAAWGAGAVPTLACGAAALGLLTHGAVVLARASAHT
jgi:hypothetical protein